MGAVEAATGVACSAIGGCLLNLGTCSRVVKNSEICYRLPIESCDREAAIESFMSCALLSVQ
jgi:hypothetical protein